MCLWWENSHICTELSLHARVSMRALISSLGLIPAHLLTELTLCNMNRACLF